MGRWGLILASVVILSGCALPLPVRVALWAIDGTSYLTTQKSVTDHGISFVAKKDCSILRGVTEKQFCVDGAPGDTAVAAAEGGNNVEVAATAPTDADDLDKFETAAGPATNASKIQPIAAPVSNLPVLEAREIAPTATLRVVMEDSAIAKLSAAVPPKLLRLPSSPSSPSSQPRVVVTPVGAGYYYVVGSFRYRDNAQALAGFHPSLAPTIVEARLAGETHFRVVVGPFERSRGADLRRRLRRAGISDAWAIALNPVEWPVARSGAASPPRSRAG